MKIQLLSVLAMAFLLGGCVDNGKGPSAPAANGEEEPMPLTAQESATRPYEGAGGAGKLDLTSPNMPASTSLDGSTASAFPKTVQPGASGG